MYMRMCMYMCMCVCTAMYVVLEILPVHVHTRVLCSAAVVPQSEKGLRQITEVVMELDFFVKSK